jgi:peptidoglycan/xylan/chitin deacetylase (PgdA/CDA1 family)
MILKSFKFCIFDLKIKIFTTLAILLISFVISLNLYPKIKSTRALFLGPDTKSNLTPESQNYALKGLGIKGQDLLTALKPKVIENFDTDYAFPPVKQASNTVRIPVLIWHHVGPLPGYSGERTLNVTTEIFRQQLEHLKVKGYKTLSIAEFIELLKTGKNPKQKSVLLTFDDGYLDNYTTVFPLLKEYGFTGTFFIPLARSEISKEQLKEMADAGMDIESHTLSHWVLSHVTNENVLVNEVLKSKAELEQVTGKPVLAIAYPKCVYNEFARSYIETKTGYELAFQCGNTKGTSIDMAWGNRFNLFRSWAYNDLLNFEKRISGYENRPKDNLPEDKNGFHFKII